jgi:acyl-CoA synthetase (AMP-forming)/AMP-acid ligase II
VYEAIATEHPDYPCQRQGARTFTWGDFDRRADALAADLLEAGLNHQSKVAAYLTNCPEYLETYLAAFKAGLVPVNTNFRYGPDEIHYLFDNADAEAVVFHAGFAKVVDQVRHRLPQVRRWYVVDDGHPLPRWAVPYDEVVGRTPDVRPVRAPWGRSGDDLLLLYTGGTTGMPKGVMWRQDDLFNVLGASGNPMTGQPPATEVGQVVERITAPGLRMLPACPLMHGTGQFSAFIILNMGGSLVLLEDSAFAPAALWRTVEREQVHAIVIVGDAFAKPMLAELRAHPGDYDLSSVLLISSSGVMWSHESKEGLLEHIPQAVLIDQLGSSEAVGMASSTSTAGHAEETAAFKLGPHVHVFTDDGHNVEPGSDEVGFVALSGFVPIGYYKDDVKSAKTFRTIGGVRYSVPGDYAQVAADGTLHLLGRGSVVINTGGEKVYPEEVEEVLKQHPEVRDAVCVGLPDDRFGEVVCAVVEPADGRAPERDDLVAHVRAHLASYKAPRQVVVVDSIGRSPSGKVDYKGLRELAARRIKERT